MKIIFVCGFTTDVTSNAMEECAQGRVGTRAIYIRPNEIRYADCKDLDVVKTSKQDPLSLIVTSRNTLVIQSGVIYYALKKIKEALADNIDTVITNVCPVTSDLVYKEWAFGRMEPHVDKEIERYNDFIRRNVTDLYCLKINEVESVVKGDIEKRSNKNKMQMSEDQFKFYKSSFDNILQMFLDYTVKKNIKGSKWCGTVNVSSFDNKDKQKENIKLNLSSALAILT